MADLFPGIRQNISTLIQQKLAQRTPQYRLAMEKLKQAKQQEMRMQTLRGLMAKAQSPEEITSLMVEHGDPEMMRTGIRLNIQQQTRESQLSDLGKLAKRVTGYGLPESEEGRKYTPAERTGVEAYATELGIPRQLVPRIAEEEKIPVPEKVKIPANWPTIFTGASINKWKEKEDYTVLKFRNEYLEKMAKSDKGRAVIRLPAEQRISRGEIVKENIQEHPYWKEFPGTRGFLEWLEKDPDILTLKKQHKKLFDKAPEDFKEKVAEYTLLKHYEDVHQALEERGMLKKGEGQDLSGLSIDDLLKGLTQ